MLSDTLKLRPIFSRVFDKDWLLGKLQSLLIAHSRIYLISLTPLALLGYLLLLIFPLSSVLLIGQIASSWSLQASLSIPSETLIQLLAGIAAVAFSLPLFSLRFKTPLGQKIDSNDIPTLYKTITELCQTYHINHFQHILLDDSLDIRVVKLSKLAWPFKGKRILIIGLPVLLCYSPEQVHAMLARRIGQTSGRDQFLLLWLNSLNETWQQYSNALAKGSILALPIATMFKLYTQLLQAYAQFAYYLHELTADRYALDVANDQDMAELFSQTIITEKFLQQKYWPKIHQLAQRKSSPEYLPYANMSKVLQNGLTRDDIQNWLKKALHYPTISLRQASLTNRLHNIGYEKPRPPRRIAQTAGKHYLSNTILMQAVNEFDQRWLHRSQ